MKRKVLIFFGFAIAMTIAIYLVFLLFDVISGEPRRTEGREILFAVTVGFLTSAFNVFFTKFFDRKGR